MVIAGLTYFTCVYNFYGSVFGIEALKGSILFNLAFLATADILGSLFIEPVLKRFTRKGTFYFTLMVNIAIACVFYFVQVPPECI